MLIPKENTFIKLSSAFVFNVGYGKKWVEKKMCRVQISIFFSRTDDRPILYSPLLNSIAFKRLKLVYERNITRKMCNFMRQSTANIWWIKNWERNGEIQLENGISSSSNIHTISFSMKKKPKCKRKTIERILEATKAFKENGETLCGKWKMENIRRR